jgi:phage baseplate assembly protein W
MSRIFDPQLGLDAQRPWLDGDRALATRIRMVLETRPGHVPWRPTFGCDLAGLVGFPVTRGLLEHARGKVETALRDWIRDAELVRVEVHAVPSEGGRMSNVPRTVPTAEAALLAMGVAAMLEIDVEMKSPDGYVSVSAVVAP